MVNTNTKLHIIQFQLPGDWRAPGPLSKQWSHSELNATKRGGTKGLWSTDQGLSIHLGPMGPGGAASGKGSLPGLLLPTIYLLWCWFWCFLCKPCPLKRGLFYRHPEFSRFQVSRGWGEISKWPLAVTPFSDAIFVLLHGHPFQLETLTTAQGAEISGLVPWLAWMCSSGSFQITYLH